MEWTSNDLEQTVERVNRLRSRYDTLKRRLRRAEGVDEIERLDASIQRRRAKIHHLNGELHRLIRERDRLEGEVLGCFHGAEALLVDLIDRLEALDGPAWSPDSIPGYTMLDIVGGVVHDGDHTWPTPVLRPGCPSGRLHAPHDRVACAGLPCGVLTWKSIDKLPGIGGDTLRAVGEVAMSGRVIEHTDGYRAEVGEIISLVAFDTGRWFHSRHAGQIGAFFADPTDTFEAFAAPIPADAMLYIEVDLFLGDGV